MTDKIMNLATAVLALLVFQAAAMAADDKNALGWPGLDLQGLPCTGLNVGYGPFDYTNPHHFKYKLPIVEGEHFTKNVERLKGGKSARLHQDLDYTLRAFPNHHRALNAVTRYSTGAGAQRRAPLISKTECYFQRAITYQPKDAIARLLFGAYLHKMNVIDRAMDQYQKALALKPNHPSINYNIGLLYFDLKKFEKSREFARKAYGKGYRLSGLRNKLAKAGYPLN